MAKMWVVSSIAEEWVVSLIADDIVVDVRNLQKRYGEVVAIADVSLAVRRGRIVGLLGPNGAGKTTLLEIVVGLRRATDGSLTTLGLDPWTARQELLQRISVQPQEATFFPLLTAFEAVELWAALYDCDTPPMSVLKRSELADIAERSVDTLSVGQRRRLIVALAIMPDTELILLDEPTSGLDPTSRRLVWQQVRAAREGGATILLTTHDMDEAEQLCDSIAIVDRGVMVASGTPRSLVATHTPGRSVRFRVRHSFELPDEIRNLASDVSTDEEDWLCVHSDDSDAVLSAIARLVPEGSVADIQTNDPSLEDVFLRLTQSRISATGDLVAATA